MGNVVDRATLEAMPSVHTPAYSSVTHVINPPNFDVIYATPKKYRKISGDTLSVMNQTEKDAADAAEAAAILAAARAAAKSVYDSAAEASEKLIKAVALVVMDETNLHAEKITGVLNAIDNGSTLANIKTAVAAIADAPQRTAEQFKAAVAAKLDTL